MMNTGDRSRFAKAADKVLDVFSDGRIRDHDLMYVAFYTVINAYPEVVLDRIIEFAGHVEYERNRIKEETKYEQDTLF
jgi:F0F1-type ATP synthase gamma subunit